MSPRTQIKSIYSGSISNESSLRILKKTYSHLVQNSSSRQRNRARRKKIVCKCRRKHTPLKFASSGLESRFARVEHIKQKLAKCKHDLFKYFEEGGSSDDAHPKTLPNPKSK